MDKKIMTHIVCGYPSMKECEKTVLTMVDHGISYVELQIPFSDPIADGPVLQKANQAAIDNGVKVKDCFELMKRLKQKTDTPLLFMTYFNIVHHYGVEEFCKKASECGAYGLIVPDIPVDEEHYENFLGYCEKYGLNAIQIISPLTPAPRLERIGKVARGFVYCVSKFGVTGAGSSLNPELSKYLKTVRKYVKVPLAVGFGISSAAHVKAVHKDADIAVIGSKLMNINPKSLPKVLETLFGLPPR